MSSLYRKLFLLSIKYGPSILAITCCLKIYVVPLNKEAEVLHWINLGLNLFFLGIFYVAGKYFNYCWKHTSLCRITLWGMIYCAMFLICDTPRYAIEEISLYYIVFVLIVSIYYKL